MVPSFPPTPVLFQVNRKIMKSMAGPLHICNVRLAFHLGINVEWCPITPLGDVDGPGVSVLGVGSEPLQSYLGCFRAVVGNRHVSEPGVIKRLPGRDALGGVVHKNLLEQVQEKSQKGVVRRNNVLLRVSPRHSTTPALTCAYTEVFHVLHKSSRRTSSIGSRVVKPEALEVPANGQSAGPQG